MPILVTIILLVLFALAIRNHRNAPEISRKLIASATPIFRTCELLTGEERFDFQGSSATIVKSYTNVLNKLYFGTRGDFIVTIIARNPFGEYFQFKRVGMESKARVAHLPQSVAKALLKSEYVPPSDVSE